MSKRDEQRETTRRRIVNTAVELLVSAGVAATTSSAVQRKAGLSRGALLHHFPTHETLLAATVRRLVEINEEMAKRAAFSKAQTDDAAAAIRTLRQVVESPYFAAELSLWAAASTDPVLREVLRHEEAASRRDLYRVVDEVFGAELAARPRYPAAASLTVVFLRGLALSRTLASESRADRLTEEWAGVVRAMLEDESTDPPAGGSEETRG